MSTPLASSITARIDRLPPTRAIWQLVLLLSVGGFFEVYDLFQMTYLPAGLVRDGIFHVGAKGLFGMSDQGALGAATFAGLFIGEMLLSRLADVLGRRLLFTSSLALYTAASVAMGWQHTAMGICLCRLIAGCGVGAELITMGAYLTELVPKAVRGRAFAVCFAVGYLAMPVLAFASWQWIPYSPLGLSGWRWVVLFGGSGAIVAGWLQTKLPESPRWLAARGRAREAESVLTAIEQRVQSESGRALSAPQDVDVPISTTPSAPTPSMWDARYRGRTWMLIAFNAFLSIGFFGFSQWLPTLLVAQGAAVTKSLWYAFLIAFAYPASPFVAGLLADRLERKWIIVATAAGVALFGTAFAMAGHAPIAVVFGLLVTLCNAVMASNGTAYQAEIFPTHIRSKALGFVHSIGRLTGIASSLLVALLLEHGGPPAVFVLIAASMAIVIVSIGAFGPRTNGRSLEDIAAGSRGNVRRTGAADARSTERAMETVLTRRP